MRPITLISGGSDGLGKAIARTLSATHTVIILARDSEKTALVAQELGVDFVCGDVRSASDMERIVSTIVDKYGRIDVLVNNAGVWIGGPISSHSYEEIEMVLDINYKGTVLLTRAVVPHMETQKSGYIFNIVSTAGLTGKKERTIYNSSKFAVSGFTKSLQPELAPLGIRVTGLYPGPITTGLFAKGGFDRDLSHNALAPEDVADTIRYLLHTPPSFLCTEMGMQHIEY